MRNATLNLQMRKKQDFFVRFSVILNDLFCYFQYWTIVQFNIFFQILQSHHSFIAEFDLHSFQPSDLLFLTSGSRSQNQTFFGKKLSLCDSSDFSWYSFLPVFLKLMSEKTRKSWKMVEVVSELTLRKIVRKKPTLDSRHTSPAYFKLA